MDSVHIFSSPTSFIKELVIPGRFQTGAPYQIQFMELFDSLTLVFKKMQLIALPHYILSDKQEKLTPAHLTEKNLWTCSWSAPESNWGWRTRLRAMQPGTRLKTTQQGQLTPSRPHFHRIHATPTPQTRLLLLAPKPLFPWELHFVATTGLPVAPASLHH